MSKHQVTTMIFSRAYKLGDPVELTQYGPFPYDAYSFRKRIESYGMNKYHIEFVKFVPEGSSRAFYSVGFGMQQAGVTTQEDLYALIGKEMGIEPTQEAIAAKINSLLAQTVVEKV